MNKRNSLNFSLWVFCVRLAKKGLKSIQGFFRQFDLQYPNLSQTIQITFIYFFALIDLIHSILNTVFSLGYFPETLEKFYPLITAILEAPIFRLWSSPEKVFFLSYVVLEFMVVRSTFKFSKIVRYNILLIFSVLMLQGLAISYWDLLFHRQIAEVVSKWSFDQGAIIFTDKTLAIFFFLTTFMLFIVLYSYFYLNALRGEFPTFSRTLWLTDSIAFWLKIKTSTMPYGKKKER
jgi:hypothetical protein